MKLIRFKITTLKKYKIGKMLIFSFDAGIKNLGVCALHVARGEQYHAARRQLLELRDKLSAALETLHHIHKQMQSVGAKVSKVEIMQNFYTALNTILSTVCEINRILPEFLAIKFINTIDLLNGADLVKKVTQKIRVERLAYVLYCLDAQYGPPDVVLIEKQFTISEHVNAVSKYIENHYCHVSWQDFKLTIAEFPLSRPEPPKSNKTKILIVNPILKNTCDIDKSRPYSHFIAQYSNKTSNKKHTNEQFKYWCHIWGINIHATRKTDDSADAFMMAYAMIKTGQI